MILVCCSCISLQRSRLARGLWNQYEVLASHTKDLIWPAWKPRMLFTWKLPTAGRDSNLRRSSSSENASVVFDEEAFLRKVSPFIEFSSSRDDGMVAHCIGHLTGTFNNSLDNCLQEEMRPCVEQKTLSQRWCIKASRHWINASVRFTHYCRASICRWTKLKQKQLSPHLCLYIGIWTGLGQVLKMRNPKVFHSKTCTDNLTSAIKFWSGQSGSSPFEEWASVLRR